MVVSCSLIDHTGLLSQIPQGTRRFESYYHRQMECLSTSELNDLENRRRNGLMGANPSPSATHT